MANKLETFIQPFLKKDLPDIRPGDTVRIYQKIKETPKKGKTSTGREDKERIQVFEGVVLARKHGKGISATITVRKVVSGIGVERVFPIHSPLIEKIEILKRAKVRRAKLYYLRKAKGKRARLKKIEFKTAVAEKKPIKKKPAEEKIKENKEENKEYNETKKKTEN